VLVDDDNDIEWIKGTCPTMSKTDLSLKVRGRVLEFGGMVLDFGRRVLDCGGNGIGLIYLVGERRFVPRYYVFIFSCWVDLRITRLLCISQECR
jgi:hypothetical protein